MNDDKIKNIFENKIIREKLYNAGMYPMIGPTGPRGKKIEILDSYDTYEKLLEKHPKGNIGPKGDKDITINNTGLFEITVCGRISGVTTETGGKFSLRNTTTGKDLTDLSFELNKGNTEDMDFSEVAFAEITAPANLRIKTEITGDKNTSNILFSTINVLIKGYYV